MPTTETSRLESSKKTLKNKTKVVSRNNLFPTRCYFPNSRNQIWSPGLPTGPGNSHCLWSPVLKLFYVLENKRYQTQGHRVVKVAFTHSFVAVSLSSQIQSLICFTYSLTIHVYNYLLISVIRLIVYFMLRPCLSH